MSQQNYQQNMQQCQCNQQIQQQQQQISQDQLNNITGGCGATANIGANSNFLGSMNQGVRNNTTGSPII